MKNQTNLYRQSHLRGELTNKTSKLQNRTTIRDQEAKPLMRICNSLFHTQRVEMHANEAYKISNVNIVKGAETERLKNELTHKITSSQTEVTKIETTSSVLDQRVLVFEKEIFICPTTTTANFESEKSLSYEDLASLTTEFNEEDYNNNYSEDIGLAFNITKSAFKNNYSEKLDLD